MRNIYQNSVRLALALLLFTQIVSAQVRNQGFIPPLVLRQAYTNMIRQAPDGKLYVYGDISFHGDRAVGNLVRLNPDGLLDTSFNPTAPLDDTRVIEDLDILSNGNVACIVQEAYTAPSIVVMAQDGQVLKTIDPGFYSQELAPDNSGGFYLANSTGDVVQYSSALTYVRDVAKVDGEIREMQLDGSQIVIAGRFSRVLDAATNTYHTRNLMARFDLSGRLDHGFNASEALEGFGNVESFLIQPDGKILPVDKNTSYYGNTRPIRLNADGSLDTGFAYPFPSLVIEDAFYIDGKLTVVTNRKIARLNSDGSLDPSFNIINYARANVVATVLPDQSVIAGNYVPATYGFAKFSPTGERINAYYGRLMRPGKIYSMDRTSTSIFIGGDFIRVGYHFSRNIARLNPDGTVLTKFRNSAIILPVLTVEGLAGAKVLFNTPTNMYRLESDGTMDRSFSYTHMANHAGIRKFIVQPDGKILLGGKFYLTRLNANGSRDASFNAEIGNSMGDGPMDFTLDKTTGKITYLESVYSEGDETMRNTLLRLNSDGTRDESFNPPSFPEESISSHRQVIALENQEVLLVNHAYLMDDHTYDVVKLNADGSLNEEFTNNATDYAMTRLASRFGNRIILSTQVETSSEDELGTTALFLDGVKDEAFRLPVSNMPGTTFYSDNDTELFVMLTYGEYPLVKLTYPPTSTMVATSAGSEEQRIRFFPNPVQDRVTVDVKSPGTVSIFDATGFRKVRSLAKEGENSIELNHLKPGRYIIEVMSDGAHYREHFVKE